MSAVLLFMGFDLTALIIIGIHITSWIASSIFREILQQNCKDTLLGDTENKNKRLCITEKYLKHHTNL